MYKMFLRFLILSVVLLTSCKTLPPDPFPNQMALGFLGVELNHWTGHTVGSLDINLTDDNFANENFQFVGIWTGVLIIKSAGCEIEKTMRFNQIATIKISDLIPRPMKCIRELYAYTDQPRGGGRTSNDQHNITEHGRINLNYESNPLTFIVKGIEHSGQASIQKMEGSLTLNSQFQIKTPSKVGTYYVEGCSYGTVTGQYTDYAFTLSLQKLYNKKILSVQDSCDFEVRVSPDDNFPESFLGNIAITVYSGAVVKLEQPNFSISSVEDPDTGDITKTFKVSGANYIAGIAINSAYALATSFEVPYRASTVYWVRTVTKNGRKSVMAVQNMKVLWKAE